MCGALKLRLNGAGSRRRAELWKGGPSRDGVGGTRSEREADTGSGRSDPGCPVRGRRCFPLSYKDNRAGVQTLPPWHAPLSRPRRTPSFRFSSVNVVERVFRVCFFRPSYPAEPRVAPPPHLRSTLAEETQASVFHSQQRSRAPWSRACTGRWMRSCPGSRRCC